MAGIATLVDDFSSFNAARWSSTLNSGSASVSAVGGRLRVVHDYANAWSGWPPPYTQAYSAGTFEIAASSLYWRFYPPVCADQAWMINVQMGATHSTLGNEEGFGWFFQNGSLKAIVWNHMPDEWQVEAGSLTYSATTHAWLRVREAGGTFYWDTAPDDGTGKPGAWTQRFSLSSTATGVQFDGMASFLGANGARAFFRTYSWSNTFLPSNLTSHLEIDGVNTALVASTTHSTSGALTGPGAVMTGTARRLRAHGSTGALAASGAAVAGSADRKVGPVTHSTSGALAGPGAALAGTSKIIRTHDTSGVLEGQGSAMIGSANIGLDPTKVASIRDTFDAGAINTAVWETYVLGGAAGTITQAGGKLRLNLTSGALGNQLLVSSVEAKSLQDSKVFGKLSRALVTANNSSGAEVFFSLSAQGADNSVSWHQQSNGTMVPQWRIGGESIAPLTLSYTPSTHAWLQIREHAGIVYWESAPASANDPPLASEWTVRYQKPLAELFPVDAMYVALGVNYWGGNPGAPTGPVEFDCVNTQTRTPIVHATSGALAAHGASLAGTAAKRVLHTSYGDLVGIGAAILAEARREKAHYTSGALFGASAIISGISSTSDETRRVWEEAQDTGGAWADQSPQDSDPWTPTEDTGGAWGS